MTTGARTPATLLLPAVLAGPHNPDWHALRRRTGDGWSITASEIATVLGLDPWNTPFSLWWQKREGWTRDDNEAMAIGRLLEDGVCSLCAGRHPNQSLTPGGLYAHPDRPWQLATPDRLLFARVVCGSCDYGLPMSCVCPTSPLEVVDAKTAARVGDGWGEDGTDDIPVHYRAQLLWQMDVLGAPRGRLAVLFLQNRQYREYVVDYDPDDIAVMLESARRFRRDLDEGTPPPVDGHPATTATLRRVHPTVVDAPVEISADLAEAYRRAVALSTRFGDVERRLKNRIRAAMGTYKTATVDGRRVAVRSVYDQTFLQTKTLRAERPEVYAAYATKKPVDKLLPGRDLNR